MSKVWIAALAALAAACAATAPAAAPAAPVRVADLEPSFQALQQALDADDDALARHILDRIEASKPIGKAAEAAAAFERILDGRELAHAIGMRLECRPVEGKPGSGRLVLVIDPDCEGEVELRARAAMLSFSFYGIDSLGHELRSARTESRRELEQLALHGGQRKVVELIDYDLPLGQALAVRGHFGLELIQPELARAGEDVLPASLLKVAPAEALRLAPRLTEDAATADQLLALLEHPGFQIGAALDLCVRIPPADRPQALDALAPLVARMNRIDLQRTAPCLRWLSGERDIGGDADMWRQWMADRARARADASGGSTLELPNRTPQGIP